MSSKSRPPRLVGPGEEALKALAKELGESVDLSTAAEMLDLHLSTLHRWRLNGALECWRLGGRWRVSAEALKKLIQGGSSKSSANAASASGRSESQRRAAADRALAECKELGV
jgi:excisionase family DNA binding protein